ncbi:hypothetical protein V6N13_069710 [Hibiscus sabdariffa]|uniref:Caffeoyl-CoA O-methyltransferase n=1 Tax=Hibiscus sabdariffa TaxID=183260 RepID=A0ABR2PH52_9ROSI
MADWTKKTILRSNALQQYIFETSAYPKEHEQLKELREASAEKYKDCGDRNHYFRQIIAIDPDKEAYETGAPFIKKAGVQQKIKFIPSDAFLVLNDLIKNGEEGSFDFIFVDAYKNDYLKFHELTLKLVKIGGIVAYDNTLWYGSVAKSKTEVADGLIKMFRSFEIEFNSFVAADPQVESSLLSIGDGLTLCMRLY